jgi:hypothetical protein
MLLLLLIGTIFKAFRQRCGDASFGGEGVTTKLASGPGFDRSGSKLFDQHKWIYSKCLKL